MVRRIRRTSGGFKGKLALSILVIALISVAFGLVIWMHFKNKKSEEVYASRISELEEALSLGVMKEEQIEPVEIDPVKGEWVREIEYRFIELSFNISVGDYLDVRIRYPNGEDFIVASHKKLIALNEEKGSVILQVNEEEILMLSSAEYDLKQYGGTKVYAAICRDEPKSVFSIVDYVPSAKISKLLQENPNIVNTSLVMDMGIRSELEDGLKEFRGNNEELSYYEETDDYMGNLSELPEQYGGSIWD